ncbi:MAG: DNA (cytosine-5-)-methyltransferase [Flavobacteriales bacterium]|nr:DNA (cytosine-5-)-methyltransferase [Flavobacteriales bacterium]
MKFIDLFAGVGGFHKALHSLGHECVFASEIDSELRALYQENFGLECSGDIAKVKVSEIPKHDILCAGFPCQSFSKAGAQGGLEDERGNLFHRIEKILRHHKPHYFILENVPNFEHHEQGRTWAIVSSILRDKLKYDVQVRKLSPHDFGTPQLRERLFIGCSHGLSRYLAGHVRMDLAVAGTRAGRPKCTGGKRAWPSAEFLKPSRLPLSNLGMELRPYRCGWLPFWRGDLDEYLALRLIAG